MVCIQCRKEFGVSKVTTNLTIITTIFNLNPYVDKYIDTINSLVEVTNFQLLMIDDGSTDNIELLVFNKLKIKDKTFLKNQENLGIMASLVIAINKSKTNYLMVLDSDDSLNITNTSKMFRQLSKLLSYDVVIFNENKFDELNIEGNTERIVDISDKKNFMFENFLGSTRFGTLSDKVFRRELFKDFDPHFNLSSVRFGPDNFLSFWIFLQSQKIGYYIKNIYEAGVRFTSTNRQFKVNRNNEYELFFNYINSKITNSSNLILLNEVRYFKQLVYDLTSFQYWKFWEFKSYYNKLNEQTSGINFLIQGHFTGLSGVYLLYIRFQKKIFLIYFFGLGMKVIYISRFFLSTFASKFENFIMLKSKIS